MRTTNFKNLLLALAIGSVVALPLAAHSQDAKSPSSDKLDVSGLEKKYWASKDTDFSVVQNRTYSKVHRFAFTGEYGSPLNDAYSSGTDWTFRGNYYLTERYGIELQGSFANLHDNDSLKSFEQLPSDQGIRPNYNKMGDFYGASFNWVPIYAKMSLLNSRVIYFDMAISPGVGMQQYHQELQAATGSGNTIQANKSGAAAQIDITQHYFFSNHWAVRFDWTHRWTQEKTAVWLIQNGGHAESSGTHYDSILSGGLTFFF